MATMILDRGFQWKRSSAISATLALHGLALVAMLAPPAFVALERAAPTPVLTVSVKQKEPPPPPPPPELKVVKHKPVVPVRAQPVQPRPVVQPVVTQEVTPMSTPAVEAPIEPGPIETAPVETVPSALAYSSRTPIPYPSGRNREEGTVLLRVLVGPDGVPQEITIEKSSGFVRLDRAAKAGVMKWRFQPGTRNGQPIAAYGLVPIAFKFMEL